MRALICGLTASVLLAAATPALAEAAPIRECGDAMAYSVHNITARVASCATARRAARAIAGNVLWYCGNVSCSWGSYYCTQRYMPNRNETDYRCTASGGRVIRFQRWDGD
jgi:hypothetical protein